MTLQKLLRPTPRQQHQVFVLEVNGPMERQETRYQVSWRPPGHPALIVGVHRSERAARTHKALVEHVTGANPNIRTLEELNVILVPLPAVSV
jgi:tartrate dehydratase alpha subunit/fumarate hydratase class I-like protein